MGQGRKARDPTSLRWAAMVDGRALVWLLVVAWWWSFSNPDLLLHTHIGEPSPPHTHISNRNRQHNIQPESNRTALGVSVSLTMMRLAAAVAVAAASFPGAVQAMDIYADGHFDRVSKVRDTETMDSLIESEISAGHTLFVRIIASAG
jgi:hypothetical protein